MDAAGVAHPIELPPEGYVYATSSTEHPVLDRMAITDAVRVALDGHLPGDVPGLSPWRFVLIHGGEGWAREAVYTDDDLPTHLADDLLEHFGFDPTPLGETRPDLAPYEVPSSPTLPPVAPASSVAAPAGSVRGLPATATVTPQKVQVARLTTDCGTCDASIEPGQLMGYRPGIGWVHLEH